MNPVDAVQWIFGAWRQMNALLVPATNANEACKPVNDCGCFVLLFAQLEDAINAAYESHVGGFSVNDERVAFMHRVNMLSGQWLEDKNAELIKNEYEDRCDIVHGRALEAPGILLSDVAERYGKIIEQLA
jgi:hypothetical protein